MQGFVVISKWLGFHCECYEKSFKGFEEGRDI